MRKYLPVFMVAVVLAVGCATSPEQVQDRWAKIEDAAYQSGYAYAGILYVKGGADEVNKEIIRLGQAGLKRIPSLPNWELRSYASTELRAKIEGMEDFLEGVNPDE